MMDVRACGMNPERFKAWSFQYSIQNNFC
jgi:hypothetical protein